MKTTLAVMLIIAAFLMSSCDPNTGVLTVSGTSFLGGPIKIGLFGPEANFAPGEVDDVYTGNGGTFVPLSVVTPDGNGNYSIDFPADPTTVAYLVAWIEYTDDNIFTTSDDEMGYFPTKSVEGTDYLITGWQSVGNIIQIIERYEGTFTLDAIGPGGFDFGAPG